MENRLESFSDEFVDSVKTYEGDIDYQKNVSGTFANDRFLPYYDPRGEHLLIGYGHKLDGDISNYTQGITIEEAESLLISDLKKAYDNAEKTYFDFRNFSPSIKEALVDMFFNLGGKMDDYKNFSRELSNGNLVEAARFLKHVDPGDLENNLKDTDYYAFSPERATKNIRKIVESTFETKDSIDDVVMDMVSEVDEDPFSIG